MTREAVTSRQIDDVARAIYDRVKRVQTLTFDIAYPEEQAQFRDVARIAIDTFLMRRHLDAAGDLDRYKDALDRIAQYDMTQMRSGVNTAVMQGIARDALYGDDYVLPGETSL